MTDESAIDVGPIDTKLEINTENHQRMPTKLIIIHRNQRSNVYVHIDLQTKLYIRLRNISVTQYLKKNFN